MLTQKQESFTLNMFQGMSQREAYAKAGYSTRYPIAHRDRDASLLANSPKIVQRLTELRKVDADIAISTVEERKKILTQIQRATVGDYVNEYGNLSLENKKKLKSSAVQEVKTERTLVGTRTTLKLRDPVGAIAEHNKMDKIYSETPSVNIDNRQIIFIVNDEQVGKQLIDGIAKRIAKRIENRDDNSQ